MHSAPAQLPRRAARWDAGTVQSLLRAPHQAQAAEFDRSSRRALTPAGGAEAAAPVASLVLAQVAAEGGGCPLSADEWAVWHRVRAEPMSWEG